VLRAVEEQFALLIDAVEEAKEFVFFVSRASSKGMSRTSNSVWSQSVPTPNTTRPGSVLGL
jgi:hypothetical protein